MVSDTRFFVEGSKPPAMELASCPGITTAMSAFTDTQNKKTKTKHVNLTGGSMLQLPQTTHLSILVDS